MTTKQRLLIALVAVSIIMLGGYWWLENKMATIAENDALSKNISTEISTLFNGRSVAYYPYRPQKNIDWQNKFFVFDVYSDLNYNKQRNEALGRHKYFPDKDINGLVLVQPARKILGHYKRNDNDGEYGANEAYQHYFLVSYFDMTQKAILARDTIFGPLPKQSKRVGQDQHGILPMAGQPDEDELIKAIKERIN